MRKVILSVSLGLIVLFFSAVAQAQDKATMTYGDNDLTISGYGHFWYISTDDDLGDAGDAADGFDTRRMRLILSGHLTPKVSFKVQFDMEDEQLRDYWAKFNKIIETDNLILNVTAGQGKIHFSEAERIWVSPATTIIRGPMIYEGGLVTIADRDMGVIFDGKTMEGKVTFYIGFLNGNGIGDSSTTIVAPASTPNTFTIPGETNPGDTNDQSDLLFRVIVAPFEDEQLKSLTFGLGYMNGAQTDFVAGISRGVNARKRMSITAQYKKDDLSLLVEQISQTLEESVAAPAAWGDAETTNLYLEGSYTLHPEFLKAEDQSLQLVFRYQDYEHDDGDKVSKLDAGDAETTMITIGANLVLNKNVRFMFNYNMIDDDTYVLVKDKDMDVDNNEILLQLEFKF